MRILVDGDSCPVLNICEEIAKKLNIELIVIVDINHILKIEYGEIIKVDSKNQSVDIKLFNIAKNKDVVITQDYGLAAIILTKGCRAISPDGKVFTNENIDNLLLRRHLRAKIRRAGGRHRSHKKRTSDDDLLFKKNLISLIDNNKIEE